VKVRAEVLCYKSACRGIESQIRTLGFRIPSSRSMALRSTQPLTKMSTRNFPGGQRGDRRVKLTTFPPSVSQLSRRCGILDTSHTYGPSRPVTWTALPFRYVQSIGS
jgi:hypothetical protein